jgi:hypothetical protein
MVSKKKDMKIQKLDKNMNITYELALISEEYNSAKQKYDEIVSRENLRDKAKLSDEEFIQEKSDKELKNTLKARMDILLPKMENLAKMKQDRINQDINRAEEDKIYLINKKNLEKQRKNDLKNSLLNRKNQREGINANPYKRRECHPMNLFDKGYLKLEDQSVKKEEETHKEEQSMDIEFTPHMLHKMKNDKLIQMEEKLKNLADELEALHSVKRQKIEDDNIKFGLFGINQSELKMLMDSHNSKFQNRNYKIININDLEY